MYRTSFWLTLVVVALAVAYAAFVRTGTGMEPRSPAAEAVALNSEFATHTEPLDPSAPIVVSVPPRPDRSSKSYEQSPPIPENSIALIREIQRELQRVGCYERGINGIWTTSSRMAAQTFTERMNARLPIETPDAALLSLLQSQQQPVCGSPCPPGPFPGPSNDGGNHCVPGALGVGTSLSAKLPGALDKPAATAAAPEPQASHERRATDADTPAGQRPVQPAAKKAAPYWRYLMRSVDRALGFY